MKKELSLSKHLFWDIDMHKIDYIMHAAHIIRKVLQFGLYSDWKKISGFYGLDKIIEVASKMRDLDLKTASFLSIVSGVSKNNFICYNTKQSIPKHWNFQKIFKVENYLKV